MTESDWFEEGEEDDLSEAERLFLAHLRVRTSTWDCGPDDTQLVAPADGRPYWRAVLDVPVEVGRGSLALITVGLCFNGTRIRGSEVHNQSFHLCPDGQSRVEVVEATGAPQELAVVAADWFERILTRPVERREQWDRGYCMYGYAFSDTGTELVSGTDTITDPVQHPFRRVIHARGRRSHAAD